MSADWTILHAGALGDLALSLQLALRLPGVGPGSTFTLISRTPLPGLAAARPRIHWVSPETVGGSWLHHPDDGAPPPAALARCVQGRLVLNLLSDLIARPHEQLLKLEPRKLYSVDPRPELGRRAHITEQWSRRLQQQGALLAACRYRTRARTTLGRPPDFAERSAAMLARHGLAAGALDVLIHPGSGGRRKCWPLENFAALATMLAQRAVRCAMLVGPVECESWPTERIERLRECAPLITAKPARDGAELDSMEMLLAALGGTRVLIGNDAGPGHLAALLGASTLSIFGPTDPAVWRPLGGRAHVLRGDPDRAPDWGLPPAALAARALEILPTAARC